MRAFTRALLVAAGVTALPTLGWAKVMITVDLANQTMHVVDKDVVYDWRISSGRSGFATPPGTYGVLWMDKDHYSDEYDNAPMPNAIFFKSGFAIHGAYKSDFGHPASHGCIRLPVDESATLFKLVKEDGAEVKIVGTAPRTIEARNHHRHRDETRVAADSYYGAPAYGYGYGYGYGEDDGYGAPPYPGVPVQGYAAPGGGFFDPMQ